MDISIESGQWDFGLDDEQEARAARLHQECLIARGYDDEQIAGILGENFMRVFEQVCG